MADNNEIFEFRMIPQQERFYNPDTSYGVYAFTTNDVLPYFYDCYDDQMNPMRGSVLAGNMQHLTIGMSYLVRAKVVYSNKYRSHQYEPFLVTADVPKTHDEQVKYLKTQVTETQARNILAAYPNIVDDIINGNEIGYLKIKGIGEKTWRRIEENIKENYGISDVLTMLQPLGITYKMVKKLLSGYASPELFKQDLYNNPYVLTKLRGLGFKRVDDLVLKLFPKLRNSDKRTVAFLRYFFKWIGENDGDTWITVSGLDAAVREYIPECEGVYKQLFEEEVKIQRFLHIDGNKVGLQEYYRKEHSVAEILEYLNSFNTPFVIDFDNGVKTAEKQQLFSYTEEQIESLKKCCESNVVFICGGAGVGKTSLLRGLIAIYRHYSIACCALSAKAAQRIFEATGHPATTIHRLLKYNGIEFGYDEKTRLPEDVIIIDEASMINTSLFLSLVSAIKEGAKVIICGDDGQLPPIGYGNAFHDLLNRDLGFACCKLTKIMRQAAKSGIITDAWDIRNNRNPLKQYELKTVRGELLDMTYMFRDNREAMRDLAIKIYFTALEKLSGNVEDIAIIVPCKRNRTNCTEDINRIILNHLIPEGSVDSIKYGSKEFRIGARVIQVVNDYQQDVFNGEMGYVRAIYTNKEGNNTVRILEADFNGKIAKYKQTELDSIELGYCLTVHKMQGSGVRNIIMIIDNTHYKLLDSCLLYTGLTRAISKCLLIAEPKAFEKCIGTKASDRRTWLSFESEK